MDHEDGLVTAKLCKMAILYKTHILSKVAGQKGVTWESLQDCTLSEPEAGRIKAADT